MFPLGLNHAISIFYQLKESVVINVKSHKKKRHRDDKGIFDKYRDVYTGSLTFCVKHCSFSTSLQTLLDNFFHSNNSAVCIIIDYEGG